MSDVIDSDGFRANVGIILMRSEGEVFLGRRTGGRGWQFPQGGMRRGENPREAVLRELHEEVGLQSDDVEILGHTARWLRYRLPARFIRRNRKPVCIGQKQRWFLMRLRNAEVRFELEGTEEPEFDQWRWVNYWEPAREVIYFKRPVYVRALAELAPLAFPNGTPVPPPWWEELTRRPKARSRAAAASAG